MCDICQAGYDAIATSSVFTCSAAGTWQGSLVCTSMWQLPSGVAAADVAERDCNSINALAPDQSATALYTTPCLDTTFGASCTVLCCVELPVSVCWPLPVAGFIISFQVTLTHLSPPSGLWR